MRSLYKERLSILSQLSEILNQTINQQISSINLLEPRIKQNINSNSSLEEPIQINKESQLQQRTKNIQKKSQVSFQQMQFCAKFIKIFYQSNEANWKILFQNEHLPFKQIQKYIIDNKLSYAPTFKQRQKVQNQQIHQNRNQDMLNTRLFKGLKNQAQSINSFIIFQHLFYNDNKIINLEKTTCVCFQQNFILVNPTIRFIQILQIQTQQQIRNKINSEQTQYKTEQTQYQTEQTQYQITSDQISSKINCIYLTTSNINCILATIYYLLYVNFPIQILTTKLIYGQFLKVVAFLANKSPIFQNQSKQISELQKMYSKVFNVCLVQPKQYFQFHGFTAILQQNLFPFECYDLQILQKGRKILVIQTQNIENLKIIYLKHKSGQISLQKYQKYVYELQRRQFYFANVDLNQKQKLKEQKIIFLFKQIQERTQKSYDKYSIIKHKIKKNLQNQKQRIIFSIKSQKANSQKQIYQKLSNKQSSLTQNVSTLSYFNFSTLQLTETQKNQTFKIIKKYPEFMLLSDLDIKSILQNMIKVSVTNSQIIQHANRQLQYVYIKLKGQFCLTKSKIINFKQIQQRFLQNITVFGWNYFLNQNKANQCCYFNWICQNQYNFQCVSENGIILKIETSTLQLILSSKIKKMVDFFLVEKKYLTITDQLNLDYQIKDYLKKVITELKLFFIGNIDQDLQQGKHTISHTSRFTQHCLYQLMLKVIFDEQMIIEIQKQHSKYIENPLNSNSGKQLNLNSGKYSFELIIKQKVLNILKLFYFNSIFFNL